MGLGGVEAALGELDEHEIGGDHADEDEEEAERQRGEAEEVGEGAERQDGADDRAATGVMIIGRLGRLRKNGTRRVRIRNTTRVWVASDSTNQPLRNSAWLACRIASITKKVMKSKIELTGPNTLMKRRTNAMSHAAGRASTSSSTLSVGMASWPTS